MPRPVTPSPACATPEFPPAPLVPLFPCVPVNPPALPWPEAPYLPALSGGEWLGVKPLRRCGAPEPPLPYALELELELTWPGAVPDLPGVVPACPGAVPAWPGLVPSWPGAVSERPCSPLAFFPLATPPDCLPGACSPSERVGVTPDGVAPEGAPEREPSWPGESLLGDELFVLAPSIFSTATTVPPTPAAAMAPATASLTSPA